VIREALLRPHYFVQARRDASAGVLRLGKEEVSAKALMPLRCHLLPNLIKPILVSLCIFFAAESEPLSNPVTHRTNRNSMPSFASGGCQRERYRAVSACVRMTASAPRRRAW
jgi:hypothetical protein